MFRRVCLRRRGIIGGGGFSWVNVQVCITEKAILPFIARFSKTTTNVITR